MKWFSLILFLGALSQFAFAKNVARQPQQVGKIGSSVLSPTYCEVVKIMTATEMNTLSDIAASLKEKNDIDKVMAELKKLQDISFMLNKSCVQ